MSNDFSVDTFHLLGGWWAYVTTEKLFVFTSSQAKDPRLVIKPDSVVLTHLTEKDDGTFAVSGSNGEIIDIFSVKILGQNLATLFAFFSPIKRYLCKISVNLIALGCLLYTLTTYTDNLKGFLKCNQKHRLLYKLVTNVFFFFFLFTLK